MVNTISFPGLGIGPLDVRETIEIFGFNIHLYGLIIGIGIILAYAFALKTCHKHNLTKENVTDILLYGLPSAIVCARLYYVIFEAEKFDSFIEVLQIWNGGIAIYGAVIGAVISTYIYCRVKKINVMSAFDIGAYGLLIGQICGRWGNFVNQEAFGGNTFLPWGMTGSEISNKIYAMQLEGYAITDSLPVHPTFLYESLWNLGVFIILFLRRDKRAFEGEIFLGYITLYGLGRFWIEGLRMDSLYLGPVRVSQLVALICVLVGISIIIIKRKKIKNAAE